MNAWYEKPRVGFLQDDLDRVVTNCAAAVKENLHVEPEQKDEWDASVGLLQQQLDDKAEMVQLLKETLTSRELSDYQHVILEYDFRRRGLRLDCVLLGKGIIAIIEFKRTRTVSLPTGTRSLTMQSIWWNSTRRPRRAC